MVVFGSWVTSKQERTTKRTVSARSEARLRPVRPPSLRPARRSAGKLPCRGRPDGARRRLDGPVQGTDGSYYDSTCYSDLQNAQKKDVSTTRTPFHASRRLCPLPRRTLLAELGHRNSSARLEPLEQRRAVPEREQDLEEDEKDGEDDALQERVEERGRTAFELRVCQGGGQRESRGVECGKRRDERTAPCPTNWAIQLATWATVAYRMASSWWAEYRTFE